MTATQVPIIGWESRYMTVRSANDFRASTMVSNYLNLTTKLIPHWETR